MLQHCLYKVLSQFSGSYCVNDIERTCLSSSTDLYGFVQKTQPKVEEEEEEEVRKQPDPLHQLILHFSHNALTECR